MLEDTGSGIGSERSTGKAPLADTDVERLLSAAERVIIARGRSRRELRPADVELDDLKGPTGNYRAPILLVDGTLLVGYHAETLDELLRRP